MEITFIAFSFASLAEQMMLKTRFKNGVDKAHFQQTYAKLLNTSMGYSPEIQSCRRRE